MTSADPAPLRHVATTFRQQAEACGRLGSPMYEQLLAALADDIDADGPVREIVRGHESDAGPSALALRLAGGLHRLVLTAEASDLSPYYPSVGGVWDSGAAWPVVRETLHTQRVALRSSLDQAPQTNEVGRSTALLGGLLHIAAGVRLPVLLHEVGSSAGLNLRADHFRYRFDGGTWGRSDSPVLLDDAWSGRVPPLDAPLTIAGRFGSDRAPIDPTTSEGRLQLRSYVWPDQQLRWSRLQAALAVAGTVPAPVTRQDAVDAVDAVEVRAGHVSVLWHSVMWQYLDAAAQNAFAARVDALGDQASRRAAFAHLFMEPARRTPDRPHEFLVVARVWGGGASGSDGERRVLGTAAPHGIPTTWD